MKQGGRDLTNKELYEFMGQIGRDTFRGLEGIDAENTAPYFDDALESLVQTYGYWERGPYNVDNEYNRRDFREEAMRRALWAILVVQGYQPSGAASLDCDSQSGNWGSFDEDAVRSLTEFTEQAREVYRES
jgi:hypothetical protein